MFPTKVLVLGFVCIVAYCALADVCEKFANREEELSKCCTAENPFLKDTEVIMKCYNSTHGTEEEKVHCTAECVLREKGILGSDNELDQDKALEVAGQIEDNTWREQVVAVVKSCWSKLDTMKELSAQNPTKCPLVYMMIQLCVINSIFVECPAQEWHSSELCEEAKQSKCINQYINF